MEKTMEKWESLRLDVQQFVPQEYITQCEIKVDFKPGNGTEPSGRIWIDDPVYDVIDNNEYEKGYAANTDGSGQGDPDTFVRAWYAKNSNAAKAMENAENKAAKYAELLLSGDVGHGYSVVKTSGSNRYVGDVWSWVNVSG